MLLNKVGRLEGSAQRSPSCKIYLIVIVSDGRDSTSREQKRRRRDLVTVCTQNTFVKRHFYQYKSEAIFSACISVLCGYFHCVFNLCCRCMLNICKIFFDFRLERFFVVSCQEGITKYCGLWIPVHRCTSELCGVRQRHAKWAQKLESSIQRKTCKVTEDL
jgi:hypothetical protein